MKSKLLLGLFIVVICVALVGCGKTNSNKEIVGKWKNDTTIEGYEFIYTFNEDGTGSLTFQDTVKITWADGKITTEGGDTYEYEYKASTDVLRIKEESGWEDYCKK